MQDFAVQKSGTQPVAVIDRLRVRVCDFDYGESRPEAAHNNL